MPKLNNNVPIQYGMIYKDVINPFAHFYFTQEKIKQDVFESSPKPIKIQSHSHWLQVSAQKSAWEYWKDIWQSFYGSLRFNPLQATGFSTYRRSKIAPVISHWGILDYVFGFLTLIINDINKSLWKKLVKDFLFLHGKMLNKDGEGNYTIIRSYYVHDPVRTFTIAAFTPILIPSALISSLFWLAFNAVKFTLATVATALVFPFTYPFYMDKKFKINGYRSEIFGLLKQALTAQKVKKEKSQKDVKVHVQITVPITINQENAMKLIEEFPYLVHLAFHGNVLKIEGNTVTKEVILRYLDNALNQYNFNYLKINAFQQIGFFLENLQALENSYAKPTAKTIDSKPSANLKYSSPATTAPPAASSYQSLFSTFSYSGKSSTPTNSELLNNLIEAKQLYETAISNEQNAQTAWNQIASKAHNPNSEYQKTYVLYLALINAHYAFKEKLFTDKLALINTAILLLEEILQLPDHDENIELHNKFLQAKLCVEIGDFFLLTAKHCQETTEHEKYLEDAVKCYLLIPFEATDLYTRAQLKAADILAFNLNKAEQAQECLERARATQGHNMVPQETFDLRHRGKQEIPVEGNHRLRERGNSRQLGLFVSPETNVNSGSNTPNPQPAIASYNQ